ncbi:MAG TPA: carbohydrate ABC transporter permease [Acidimicrobiia bacterium]|jgi:sn-glycerol 3-phosphate transport system permease protein|nr:carbohydrate ABC transporter permease [Acidimicrobiia bacterium]
MSGELNPGFQHFIVLVAVVFAAALVLGIVGLFAPPAVARRARTVNRYVLLSVLSLIVLFPIYITVVNSLLPADKIAARPPTLFPTSWLWSGYSQAWTQGHVSSYLFNSLVVTFFIVAGQLVTSICAAYAFAFLEFPLKRTIFVVFLSTMMVPFEVVFFTNLQTVVSMGDVPVIGRFIGLDTYGALVIPFLATGFGAFLVRQAFLSLPRDLRDAAELDGYGHMRFMWRVAVPLARPTIAALALFSFFEAWNQYLWPLVASEHYRTVQVGLRQLSRVSLDQINVTFAGTVLAALPLFILLLVFQKQLVRGLTAGAVKG